MITEDHAILVIISGPAGSGKTTLCDKLCASYSTIDRVITTTTRPPRAGEINGVDYYFISKDEFEQKIQRNEFYEYAKVHSGYYGSLKSTICERLKSGRDLLLNIDVQGAAAFSKTAKDDIQLAGKLVTIFISASIDQLRERLVARGKDSHDEIERRLKTAELEIANSSSFNYIIHSKSREDDFKTLKLIYEKERNKAE